MSKKDNEAEDTVLEFINKHNRPYSATDISNFMQKDFGKTAIIRALDNLVNKKLIIEKLYGKQKVFMPDQEKLPVVQDSELKTLDIQINELSEKLKDSKNEMKLLESQLKNFETSLSIAEARVLFDKTEKERTELNSKLESIKSNEVIITVEERTKTFQDYERVLKEFKKRKRIVNEILDTILENYPKNKKQLLEEIGIEEQPNPLEGK